MNRDFRGSRQCRVCSVVAGETTFRPSYNAIQSSYFIENIETGPPHMSWEKQPMFCPNSHSAAQQSTESWRVIVQSSKHIQDTASKWPSGTRSSSSDCFVARNPRRSGFLEPNVTPFRKSSKNSRIAQNPSASKQLPSEESRSLPDSNTSFVVLALNSQRPTSRNDASTETGSWVSPESSADA